MGKIATLLNCNSVICIKLDFTSIVSLLVDMKYNLIMVNLQLDEDF